MLSVAHSPLFNRRRCHESNAGLYFWNAVLSLSSSVEMTSSSAVFARPSARSCRRWPPSVSMFSHAPVNAGLQFGVSAASRRRLLLVLLLLEFRVLQPPSRRTRGTTSRRRRCGTVGREDQRRGFAHFGCLRHAGPRRGSASDVLHGTEVPAPVFFQINVWSVNTKRDSPRGGHGCAAIPNAPPALVRRGGYARFSVSTNNVKMLLLAVSRRQFS